MIKKTLLLLVAVILFPAILLADTMGSIENYYSPNAAIPIGESSVYYVNISGAPSNAIITKLEAKFTYIAFLFHLCKIKAIFYSEHTTI